MCLSALVAQWIERLLAEQKVRRSTRLGGTKLNMMKPYSSE
jgi:hypothetical protein